ncbi:hypothetical protein [Vibrio sp. 10N.222.52.B7]|uniref:hypothetical protein n=2 Tax=unclassified Vibrio TaxID=2614977 RepID=UPI00354C514C
MTYQCNDSSCRPCKHVELNVVCPNCLDRKLIVAPHGEWVYCPDHYVCEWEMSFDDFQKADIDGERKATIQRKLDWCRQEIEDKKAQIVQLEAQMAAIEAKR